MNRIVLLFVVIAMALSGCAPAAQSSRQEDRQVAQSDETTPGLRDVEASSAEESATLSAFLKTRGQPGGGHPVIAFEWTRVSAEELPPQFVPADTLGRGLLTALVTSSNLRSPSATDPVGHAELLLEDGLVISAGTGNRRGPRTLEEWNRVANDSVGEADRNFSVIETATVGDSVALIRVGAALSGFTEATTTNVEWMAPPWRFSIELRGEDIPAALRIARSFGR